VNPPEHAVVLCADEKSQVQALDRSQPVLPMMPGMPEKRTHDYVRHGTLNLFAAFNIASGLVIAKTYKATGRRNGSSSFEGGADGRNAAGGGNAHAVLIQAGDELRQVRSRVRRWRGPELPPPHAVGVTSQTRAPLATVSRPCRRLFLVKAAASPVRARGRPLRHAQFTGAGVKAASKTAFTLS
jgi:hypothetical protein